MTLDTTLETLPAVDAGHLTPYQRRMFWTQYIDWTASASVEELEQLQAALDNFTTHEVVPISRLMRQVLADQQQRRQLPATLVSQLEAANWPVAQALG